MLIKCPECGREMSDQASACPQCGCPNPALEPTWNAEAASSERQFIENLLNTRANFSIVVFGLVVAAVATLDSKWLQVALLAASAILSGMLALATSRAQWKFDLLFKHLPKDHPAILTDRLAADKKTLKRLNLLCRLVVGGSRRKYIGYVVPWYTTALLIAGLVLVVCDVFPGSNDELRAIRLRVDSLAAESARNAIHLDSLSRATASELFRLRDSLAAVRNSVPRAPGQRSRGPR